VFHFSIVGPSLSRFLLTSTQYYLDSTIRNRAMYVFSVAGVLL
jgi:hypothetical protein